MSADDDKYPGESGRRRFVKGVVGGAALAGVGATGSAAVNSLTTSPGRGGGATEAMAIENTAGPAPRGMPQVPVEIQSDGTIKGVWPEVSTREQGGVTINIAEMDMGGKTYSSEWFQYCGVETYEGIQPQYESDNVFYVGGSPGFEWQSDIESGTALNIDMFDDYETWGNGIGVEGIGKAGTANWRSQDTEDTIPVNILRSTVIEQLAENGEAPAPDQDEPYTVTSDVQQWLQASTSQGVIAWLNKCTHFCCVPAFKAEGGVKFNASNEVYCPCHQSVYEPFSIVSTLFTARPRPDE
ncbi:Rieske 2Fe-2S domain-containing protein [Halobaculum halobium]|uniref:Rieske 2Fe-2S domain-containing protein n=1 Tax=Halobaculum halobium TaxID=3032281 RepID=A0ABD5TAH6_9EURY|nr:Rieske 2Fe-2S domain-containing protein [Halobaculum sp. SYNS20]